jgi:hypothetical protein
MLFAVASKEYLGINLTKDWKTCALKLPNKTQINWKTLCGYGLEDLICKRAHTPQSDIHIKILCYPHQNPINCFSFTDIAKTILNSYTTTKVPK